MPQPMQPPPPQPPPMPPPPQPLIPEHPPPSEQAGPFRVVSASSLPAGAASSLSEKPPPPDIVHAGAPAEAPSPSEAAAEQLAMRGGSGPSDATFDASLLPPATSPYRSSPMDSEDTDGMRVGGASDMEAAKNHTREHKFIQALSLGAQASIGRQQQGRLRSMYIRSILSPAVGEGLVQRQDTCHEEWAVR